MSESHTANHAGQKTLLIIQTGTPPDAIRQQQGDLSDWFSQQLPHYQEKIQVIRVFKDEPLPPVNRDYVAVITGSWSMVTDRLAWSERTADWIREAMTIDMPLFGVCYGHQLMADALGGEVDYLNSDIEIGCKTIELSPAAAGDALLSAWPQQFAVHLTHRQTVTRVPDGAQVLASSDQDPHQVLRYGKNALSTQFHPEFTPEISRAIIRYREQRLRDVGLDPDSLCQQVTETPAAARLMLQFIDQHMSPAINHR